MVAAALLLVGACATTPAPTDSSDDSAAAADSAVDSGDTAGADTADTGDTGDSDTAPWTDADHDGYFAGVDDCDDSRDWVHPGAPDGCDGLDQDCDGEAIPAGACGEVQSAAASASWIVEGSPDVYDHGPHEFTLDGKVVIWTEPTIDGVTPSDGVAVLGALPASVRSETAALPSWYLPRGYTESWSSLGTVELGGHDALALGLRESDYYPDASVYVVSTPPSEWPADPAWVRDLADQRWIDDHPDWWLRTAVTGGDLDSDGDGDILALWNPDPWEEDPDDSVAYTAFYPGKAAAGSHGLASEPDGFQLYTASISCLGPDLDGDGFGEAFGTGFDWLAPNGLVVLEGEDIVGADQVADDLLHRTTLDQFAGGSAIYYCSFEHQLQPTDLDGDGLADLPLNLWLYDTRQRGLAILSGGIPEGDFTPLVQQTLMPEEGNSASVQAIGWVPDQDGDDRPELAAGIYGGRVSEQRLCLIPSTGLLGGGLTQTVGVDLPLGPCLQSTRATPYAALTDLDGDGLPEWAIGDPDYVRDGVEVGATYIIAGFDIPWADASRW